MTQRKILTCKRCKHIWFSNIDPLVCPKCHLDWRFERPQKNIEFKKDILLYLNELIKHYGQHVTLGEIFDELHELKIRGLLK